jgi:hypothetical protein
MARESMSPAAKDAIQSLRAHRSLGSWGVPAGVAFFTLVSAIAWIGGAGVVVASMRARAMVQDHVDVLFVSFVPVIYLLPWLLGVGLLIRVKRASSAGDISRAMAGLWYQSILGLMGVAYCALSYLHAMDRVILRR